MVLYSTGAIKLKLFSRLQANVGCKTGEADGESLEGREWRAKVDLVYTLCYFS
jgi:hypothetical protein